MTTTHQKIHLSSSDFETEPVSALAALARSSSKTEAPCAYKGCHSVVVPPEERPNISRLAATCLAIARLRAACASRCFGQTKCLSISL